MSSGAERRASRILYWALAALLIGFGFLSLFSIGMPLLATGVALVVLAPYRARPAVFWPWLVGVVAFFVGYVLLAPLNCTAQATAVMSVADGSAAGEATNGSVVCTNLLGIDYTGGPGYNPPLWPAAIAGVASALGVGVATRLILRRRPSQAPRPHPAARD